MQFAASVYQAIGEVVMITDSNNHIIDVNQAFTQLSGYTPREAIGNLQNFMYSERHDEVFNQAILNKLNTTGIWEGEVWIRRKNGKEFAVWQLIHTIYGDNGNVLRRVALFSDVTDQKRTEESIRRDAYYDLLTGLPNRRLFHDRLGLEIKKANRTSLPIALLFIDLDRFKEVNDMHGHYVGDSLLQEAARRISACVRESDTVARLGGDEFTVILSELPDTRHTDEVAHKIVTSLSEPYNIDGEIVYVSASIGITMYPSDANSISALMNNADQAMYIAKSKGRNRFSHFTASLQQAEHPRMQFINELPGALAAKQLRIYFQPIVDLSTGRILKAEALLRWQHPILGMVSPLKFIPLAENTGLINQIGDWVFKESARFAKHWSKIFGDDFQVSVNMSPVQFKPENNNFAAEWLHHLQEIGLPGRNMAVDIGEGLLHEESGILDKLHIFRDAGIQIAIDDFGTDYSSLSQFKKFDIVYLKIDQSFILNFATDPNDLALSEVIVMAHKLGYKVIAEGVETGAQHDLLAAARCDYAQGNLYSRPVLPEEFEALLKHGFHAQTQAEGFTMSKESVLSLLNEQEAAAFLQPHMPSKSVKAWLAHDRQHDPIIPFFLVEGQPYFLESDLQNFVTRTLNTSARFVRINNRLYPERRNSLDRRRHVDHRTLAGGASQFGIKRRRKDDLGLRLHPDLMHHEGVGLDRRARSSQLAH
jgi:diguanylate cyclase (GGDEF)-like protein/PAS domain S-box-containing protein